jgi:steroid 5-alpha reductase family enzyme
MSGNWTVSTSLIRNLLKVFWIGTPRVIEEDRTYQQYQKREGKKQGAGNKEQATG